MLGHFSYMPLTVATSGLDTAGKAAVKTLVARVCDRQPFYKKRKTKKKKQHETGQPKKNLIAHSYTFVAM